MESRMSPFSCTRTELLWRGSSFRSGWGRWAVMCGPALGVISPCCWGSREEACNGLLELQAGAGAKTHIFLGELGWSIPHWTSCMGPKSQLQKALASKVDFRRWAGASKYNPQVKSGQGKGTPGVGPHHSPDPGAAGAGGGRWRQVRPWQSFPDRRAAVGEGWAASGPLSQSGIRLPRARRGICGRIQSHTCIQYGPASWGSQGGQPGQSWSPCECFPCPRGPLACCNQR